MKKLDVPQSGSQASTTASRNRFGQYNRTRAMPTQPRTDAQIAVRGQLVDCSKAWGSLSDAQRAAWSAFADAHPRTDSLGQSIALTGHQMFVGVNTLNLQVGEAIQNAVPDGTALPAPVLSIGIGTAAGLTVVFDEGETVGSKLAVFASPPLSPGRAFNGDLRLVVVKPAPSADDIILSAAELTAKYGVLSAGQKFFVQAKTVAGGNVSSVTPIAFVLT